MLLRRYHKKPQERTEKEIDNKPEQDYSELTKSEIKAILDEKGIQYKSSDTKNELLALIKEVD